MTDRTDMPDTPTPSMSELFRVFGRIGLLSFGGPAAQISLMHAELVEKKKWLTEAQFLQALSFCMLLPGPEAMQLATYTGWKLKGMAGGLLAGLLFVIPGAIVIFALAIAYVKLGDVPLVQAIFLGIKAAVVAIVLQALWKLASKALSGRDSWVLAGLAFTALFFLSVPFPIIIACVAIYGYLSGGTAGTTPPAPPRDAQTLKTICVWAGLWAAPIVLVWALGQSFLFELAMFFSQLAIVTFGGAYAVLAYMTQAVVETHGWLTTAQMMDALGLAETTPGPLILVTQFVGYLAGHETGGFALALVAGLLTLWVTFVPCFLWIFAGAPYVEGLLARPKLQSALKAISASVVGVILNLSLWFTLHVLFSDIKPGNFGPQIDLSTFDLTAALFIGLATTALLLMRMPLFAMLGMMGVLGAAWSFFV